MLGPWLHGDQDDLNQIYNAGDKHKVSPDLPTSTPISPKGYQAEKGVGKISRLHRHYGA